MNNGTCYEADGEVAKCECLPEFFHSNENFPYCQEHYDDCESNPCGAGVCEDLERTEYDEERYKCTCKDGYHPGSGLEHLKIYIDESGENGVCVETPCYFSDPCENDSECFENTVYNIAECTCGPENIHDTSTVHEIVSNYTNNYCQLSIDDCEAVPCGLPEAGSCKDGIRTNFGELAYSCECNSGYELDSETGQCVDKNECDSSPCVNTDICHNLFNDYACGTAIVEGNVTTYQCNTGWQGKNCDEEVDWCDPDPCDITGSELGGCSSTTDGFTCLCKSTEFEGTQYSYRGITCENPPQVVSNIPSSYTMGLGIDQETYDSLKNTSLNFEATTVTAMEAAFEGSTNYGGVVNYLQAYDFLTGELSISFELIFKISVAELFESRRNLKIPETSTKPIEINSSFILDPNFEIPVKQPRSRRITLDPSQIAMVNNAVSSSADSATSSAGNSGISATKKSSGSGAADAELKGDVDACINNPCQNLGKCTDKDGTDDTPAGRTCVCQPDFEGDSCEIQINDCLPNNCQNGFACKDGILDYFCDCTMSFIWSGKNCDYDNFCNQADPCSGTNGDCNGGKCTCKGTADYGWSGANCAIKDYCLTWKLENGVITGTQPAICPANSVCISQSNSKLCQCLPGFGPPGDCSGSACDGHCFNNGKCNMPGGIASCDCLPGYSGSRCENSVCDGNTCSGNGNCEVDSSGNPVCVCIPPYAASDCSLVCNNRGTLNSDMVTCTCQTGYVGNECGSVKKNCSANGVWQLDNTCLCDDGWTGNLCEVEKIVCGVHGTWVLPNNCSCDDPAVWFGSTCEENACSGISCNNHGTGKRVNDN